MTNSDIEDDVADVDIAFEENVDEDIPVPAAGTAIDKEFRKNDNIKDGVGIRDSECAHKFWIKKCSLCRTILESDSQTNCETQCTQKRDYSDLEVLVCSYELSQQLRELKIVQNSRLYWITTKDTGITALRARENVSLRESIYLSAFTSSELCRNFYRLLPESITAEDWLYIGKNAVDPNRIARLLIKLKKHENRLRHR